MPGLDPRLSGRDLACEFFAPFAIVGRCLEKRFWPRRAHKGLRHRVSTLRISRAATEKNQSGAKIGIKFPTFFVPDSRGLDPGIPFRLD
jgi:hypothetical protein